MITSKGIRTEYSFSTPAAIANAAKVLEVINQKPGLPAKDIAMWSGMRFTAAKNYLGHLEQSGKIHAVKPAKGKGYRWHPGKANGRSLTKRTISGHPAVNTVRARDCATPVIPVDPLMAALFGRRTL